MKFGLSTEYNEKYFSSKLMQKMRQGDQFQTSLYFLKMLNMRWKQVVCSLVSIPLNLPYNKIKLYETLDHWSRDMVNFNLLEKGLELVSPPHFEYDFSRKTFLMLHSINWPDFIDWLPLLLEILGNMCITIVC